eukprot:TRINITY_DN3367_c0_g1_i1.p1 TRINITY_DN3367_c0_g1~~TRINITY_DN3367_c0_g1_i1.p1  ORF type:complete len:290 (+),score=106.81 TRINITY_DN3367_c0_g1_i1:633-1502(+)
MRRVPVKKPTQDAKNKLNEEKAKREEEERLRKEKAKLEEARLQLEAQDRAAKEAKILQQKLLEEKKRLQEIAEKEKAAKLAYQQKQAAEAAGKQAQEQARRQKEIIEMRQQEQQRMMREMELRMKQEKEETLRRIAEEKEKRERYEQLRREHEQAQQLPAVKPKKKLAAPTTQKPKQVRRFGLKNAARPFEPEDDVDIALLETYAQRSLPQANLPTVTFTKKGTSYWLGQRRFEADFDEVGNVSVLLGGGRLQSFESWIENAERIEALKLKGLESAKTYTYYQSMGLVN